MKHFIWTIFSEKPRRSLPGANIVLSIYEVKKNRPTFVGRAEYCTASCMGGNTEAMRALVKRGDIKKAWLHKSGYYRPDNAHFRITEV